MADDGIFPLLILGAVGYFVWKNFQQSAPGTSQASVSTWTDPQTNFTPQTAAQAPQQQVSAGSYTPGPNPLFTNPPAAASSPFASFNFSAPTSWGQPGYNATDPTVNKPQDVTAAIDAAMAAGYAANGPGIVMPNAEWFSRCTNRLGIPIPGCV